MEVFVRLLKTTIGGKAVVGLTGLALSLFVMSHMIGNMLILLSPESYNRYGHALTSNPLIYVAEAGLIFLFVLHLVKALALTLQNSQARPQKYAVSANGDKATSATTKTMWAQGLVILVFVILHLFTFKFGNYYEVTYGQDTIRDLHRLVIEVFQQPEYFVGYIIALVVLGFHLRHGVGSSFQTLGLNHPKYTPMIKCFSLIYALVVVGGFISQPVYVYLIYRGQ